MEVEKREKEEAIRREREREEVERRRREEREAELAREKEREIARLAEERRLMAEKEEARKEMERQRKADLEAIRIREIQVYLFSRVNYQFLKNFCIICISYINFSQIFLSFFKMHFQTEKENTIDRQQKQKTLTFQLQALDEKSIDLN